MSSCGTVAVTVQGHLERVSDGRDRAGQAGFRLGGPVLSSPRAGGARMRCVASSLVSSVDRSDLVIDLLGRVCDGSGSHSMSCW